MTDPTPTPEQMAEAAKELADAKADHDQCRRLCSEANAEECRASNRLNAAAKKLRALTDLLVPPERRGMPA